MTALSVVLVVVIPLLAVTSFTTIMFYISESDVNESMLYVCACMYVSVDVCCVCMHVCCVCGLLRESDHRLTIHD